MFQLEPENLSPSLDKKFELLEPLVFELFFTLFFATSIHSDHNQKYKMVLQQCGHNLVRSWWLLDDWTRIKIMIV